MTISGAAMRTVANCWVDVNGQVAHVTLLAHTELLQEFNGASARCCTRG